MRHFGSSAVILIAVVLGILIIFVPGFGQLVADDPEAMRKLATTVPKMDIVGVRLGMAPQEVTVALKAANPAFKIDTLNLNLERAGSSGSYDAAPHWMIAHTVGPVRNFFAAPPSYAGEVVGVEFTLPPARAVSARIIREVTFPVNQPVAASNLLEALHMKYGKGDLVLQTSRAWFYDASGNVISKLTDQVRGCASGAPEEGFPMWMNGWGDYNPARIYQTYSLTTTAKAIWFDRGQDCEAYTVLQAHDLGEGLPPQYSAKSLVVTLQSAKLLNQSLKETHEYLQKQADAIVNKQKDDASKRAAPKL